MLLAEELPGPIEESAELIRIGHKINNERYRSQHEDRVSHGFLPCTDMLILHASFRNQPVVKVNIIGRKFRGAAARASRMARVIRCGCIPGTSASLGYAARPEATKVTIKNATPRGLDKVGRWRSVR